jgi:hypothetical protein
MLGTSAAWADEGPGTSSQSTTVTTVPVPGATDSSTVTVTSTVEVTMRSSPYHVQRDCPCPAQPTSKPAPSTSGLTVPRFRNFPYEDGHAGPIERRPWPTYTPMIGAGSPEGRLFAGKGSVGFGLAGKGGMRFDHAVELYYWRFSVDWSFATVVRRKTDDPVDSLVFRGTDLLSTVRGGTNLTFSPVMRPRFVWRVGGGGYAITDLETDDRGRHRVHVGPNLTTSIDVFPVRPLVLSARMDLGRMGRYTLLRGGATAGVMLHRGEFYAGYQVERVDVHPLHGPTFGMRLWF